MSTVTAPRSGLEAARAVAPAALATFAALASVGALATLFSVLGNANVDLGFWATIDHDGQALRLGQGLYHDPASASYTGLLYTPGMPFAISLLDRVHVWSGWSVLLSIGAALALAVTVARVAYVNAPGRGRLAALSAAGWGGIAIWLATATIGVLYLGYADVVAWACALCGLVLAAREDGGRRSAAGAIVLLSLAFWCKQTTIVASAAVAVWMLARVMRGEMPLRRAAGFLGALALVNVAVLGVLNLLTGGWEAYFNFLLPTHHARIYGPRRLARDVVQSTGVALLAAGALVAVAELPGIRLPRRLGLGSLLAIFLPLGFLAAMWFRSKQGGEQNQYIGVAFALAMLGALAWARAQHVPRRAAAANGIVAGLLLVALLATVADGPRLSLSRLHAKYAVPVPAPLRELAARRTVFHPVYADLNRSSLGVVYPDLTNLADLVAAGRQSGMVIDALARRRFDVVVPYSAGVDPVTFRRKELYMSTYGERDEHYLWKLDQLIRAGYAPRAGLPPSMLVRRRGPDRALAVARCFAAPRLAGAEWRTRAGGGLWCPERGGAVRLSAGPEQTSQLVSDGPVALRGRTLTIRARPGAGVRLAAGAWALEVGRLGGRWSAVAVTAGGRHAVALRARGDTVRVRLSSAPPGADAAKIGAVVAGRPVIALSG